MCPRYSRSPCRILNLSGLQHLVADSVVEELRGHQVHGPAAEESRQLVLKTDEPEPRHVTGLELHEDVDVGPEILSQDGAEQRQLENVVAPAELREPILGDDGLHGAIVDLELEQRVER